MTYSTYGTTTSSSVDAGALAVFGGLFIVYLIVVLAIAIVTIIGMWKVFTKAGQEG